MDEQTIQTNEPDITGFSDDTKETENNPETDPEPDFDFDFSEDVAKQKESSEPPATYKIKHLGKQVEVTFEELTALAQKGFDYDRIKAKLESEKNSRANRLIAELSRANGVCVEEYLEGVEAALKEQKISSLSEGFKNAGFDENAARELAKREIEVMALKQDAESRERSAESERESAIEKDVRQILKLYPDIKEFPPEVTEMCVNDGIMPSVAYMKYLIGQKDVRIRQLEQNEKNIYLSAGSLKAEAKPDEDAFLSALFN